MDLDLRINAEDDQEQPETFPVKLDIDTVKFELELKLAKLEQKLQIIKGNNTALYGDIADVKNTIGLIFIYITIVFSVLYYFTF